MVDVFKLLRSTTLGNRPTGVALVAGAPYVNFVEKQFGVVDSTPAAQDLIGVPFFSASANYSAGQPVNYLGQLYVALTSITAGAWNAANWSLVASRQQSDAHATYPILSINGGFSISQELGTTGISVNSSNPYVCDEWRCVVSGVPTVFSAQQACTLSGFSFQLGNQITVAQSTLAAGDACQITQPIEGTRIARLAWGGANAQPVSIGFYVNCSITGNICVAITNGPAARTYLVDVAIATANTWQWVTVTIPGDTAGTWPTDGTVAMFVKIGFAAGSTYRGTAGSWQAGNFVGTAATMNLAATINNTITVTGFIMVPGGILPAPSAVPFILPTYAQEIISCQRYYEQISGNAHVWGGNTTSGINYILGTPFKIMKRATPAITGVSTANGNFPASVGGFVADMFGMYESRGANVTGNGGYFASTITANARL